MGSVGGSVGRAVASNTRGPRFEFSHWQKIILNICVQSIVYWKDENKEKEAGNGPFFLKKTLSNWSSDKVDKNGCYRHDKLKVHQVSAILMGTIIFKRLKWRGNTCLKLRTWSRQRTNVKLGVETWLECLYLKWNQCLSLPVDHSAARFKTLYFVFLYLKPHL